MVNKPELKPCREAELIIKDGYYGVCGARIQCKACGCRTKSMSIRDLIITKTSLSTPITENSKKLGIIRAKQAWNQRSNAPVPSESEDGETKEKQIEEMACDMGCLLGCNESRDCSEIFARNIYNAGYRKVSEVAREIFEEIDKAISSMKYNANTPRKTVKVEELKEQVDWVLHEVVPKRIAALKKKYTEGEGDDRTVTL